MTFLYLGLSPSQVRLLRAESEQVKHQNSELKMKTQVELESLQEQLRVRKEKQYQLLEKLQGQEEAKRQADDQVGVLEESLRNAVLRYSHTLLCANKENIRDQ